MREYIELIMTIFAAVMASGGFWAYIQSRQQHRGALHDMLVGLAHDRVVHVGKGYLARGEITFDEYEDYIKYLAGPYQRLGGNGLAERIVQQVKNLPIVADRRSTLVKQDLRHTEVDCADCAAGRRGALPRLGSDLGAAGAREGRHDRHGG